MGLIEYMSRNQVGVAIPPCENDKDFVVKSINSLITNLKMIDKIILNKLANKKPYRLIEKRAENERTLARQTTSQVHCKRFTHGISWSITQTRYQSLTCSLL